MRMDPDDRIALLGRNGNGKTTLARLLAAQLAPMDGEISTSGKMRVGYFTQYQVEELEADDTPLAHMTRVMKGASPAAVRAQLGRFGFSGDRATGQVGKMSGGEKARLALALITRDAPHLLILDEPTNHLDVDAREALVRALNEYKGAVLLVSHDRHMVETTADRLVLVDDGTAREFDGSLDDYVSMILAGDAKPAEPRRKKETPRAAADRREAEKASRKRARDAETELARLTAECAAVDQAMADPKAAGRDLAKLTMTELMKRRAELETRIAAAETTWLEASEALEAA